MTATAGADLAALLAVEERVVALERAVREVHAQRLRAVLELHRSLGGDARETAAWWALHTGSGEHAARALLEEALLLGGLPGAVVAVEQGLLGVAHGRAVAELLAPVEPGPRVRVWELLLVRLRADVEQRRVRPPARLRETVHRLLRRVDAEGVQRRREQARAVAEVVVRRREDGLADLVAAGLSAADAQAVDARLGDLARGLRPAHESGLGRVKVELLRDLVLGRRRYAGACGEPGERLGRDGAGCGCLPGDAPCGASVQVLVPVSAVRDPGPSPHEGELRGLLRSAPVLRAVWVDANGVPVAVGERAERPGRDPERLGRAWERLVGRGPGRVHARHPDDHRPDDLSRVLELPLPSPSLPRSDDDQWTAAWLADPGRWPPPDDDSPGHEPRSTGLRRDPALPSPGGLLPVDPVPVDPVPVDPVPVDPVPIDPVPLDPVPVDADYWRALEQHLADLDPPPDVDLAPPARPRVLAHPHPAGAPGPYRPPADLRRLVEVRSPRCEWPGCGARSTRCDLDHDTAWPCGPTCACNLGPLCRAHHRLKQGAGQAPWLKHRQADGTVRWTSPTGRSWTTRPPEPGSPAG